MIFAKLTISYDRGLARNTKEDIAHGTTKTDAATGFIIPDRGTKTSDGKIIRGLGTHYVSEEAALLVGQRDTEARRIYAAFRGQFLSTPLDGVYLVPALGAAKAFVDGLNVQLGLGVHVLEFEVSETVGLDEKALGDWAERIKRQLSGISLGRTKEGDEDGLRALENLASCPVLKPETGNRIKELVAMLRDSKIDRIELKRSLTTLDVQIETQQLAPRQAPVLEVA